MKTISAVINARTGSTRVQNKLMRRFADSSLIEIALEKLNQLDFFEKRFLAVAEQELIDLGSRYENVEILKRDDAAVKKGVNPLEVTFEHYLRVPSDYIFVFNPCLPCIKVNTLRKAYDYFQETNFNSYTAVIPTGDWIFDSNGNALTNPDPTNVTTNKQISYSKGCHAFHIINKRFFRENGLLWTFQPNDPHPVYVPEPEAVDVDTKLEFDLAQLVYLQG